HGRDLMAQGQQRLLEPGRFHVLVCSYDPQGIAMLLGQAEHESHHRFLLRLRVYLGRAQAVPSPAPKHEIREVCLRRYTLKVAGKVRVLWRADDPSAPKGDDLHPFPRGISSMRPQDARRPKLPTAVA